VAEEPRDLIHIEGEGNGVTLRVTGAQDAEVLAGELLVTSPFVQARVETSVLPADLRAWQEALDELDAGYDVAWREGGDAPELSIEREADQDRVHVTVRDTASSTSVTVTVPLTDAWFDGAYERLDGAWKAWPGMVS
jgi:Family of unknown function (DUF5959)